MSRGRGERLPIEPIVRRPRRATVVVLSPCANSARPRGEASSAGRLGGMEGEGEGEGKETDLEGARVGDAEGAEQGRGGRLGRPQGRSRDENEGAGGVNHLVIRGRLAFVSGSAQHLRYLSPASPAVHDVPRLNARSRQRSLKFINRGPRQADQGGEGAGAVEAAPLLRRRARNRPSIS